MLKNGLTMPIYEQLARFLFRNGKLIFFAFALLVGLGSFALTQIERQGFPAILVNVASVQVVYPNADAETVEREILIPLEAEIEAIDTVLEYQGSAGDNFGLLIVTFDQNADIDEAVAELRNSVSSVTLPSGAKEAEVELFSVNGVGEFIVALTGDGDPMRLYEKGLEFETSLQGVDGVKKVTAMNPLTPEIRITFDGKALAEAGLTRSAVEAQLQGANFVAPAGSIIEDETQVNIAVASRLTTLGELKAYTLAPGVTLDDVAKIEEVVNNNDYYNRVGIESKKGDVAVSRALLYGIAIDADADILTVDESLKTALETVRDNEPKNSKYGYEIVYSQADSTRQQISEISQSMFGAPIDAFGPLAFLGYIFGGLLLVVIMLFVLMNLRVAILAALAIPLSLFATLGYLYFVGIDLNTLVLFSMVLVIGLVIDPTIVFMESMQRYIDEGMSPEDAGIKTLKTVGLGVFLAVATNAIVFIPFGVVSGFFGEIIKYIPATVIPSMIASIVIPVLFFIPIGAKILRPRKGVVDVDGSLSTTWAVSRGLKRLLDGLLKKGKLAGAIRVVVFVGLMALPLVVGGVMIQTKTVEVVQFAATDDSDFMTISGDLPDEWLFDKSVYEVVVPVQDIVAEYEEVQSFFYYEQRGNDFTLFVTLDPIKERQDAELMTATELAEALNKDFASQKFDAEIKAVVSSDGPPQEQFPVKLRVYLDDEATLADTVEAMRSYLSDVEGVDVVNDTLSKKTTGGTVVYEVDSAKGVPAGLVYGALAERIADRELGELTLGSTKYEIHSQYTGEKVNDFLELEVLPGLPLGAVATETTLESKTIARSNGKRYAEISASVLKDADSALIQAEFKEFAEQYAKENDLPLNALDFKGEADSIAESFNDLFVALAIAIFIMYALLVIFFRSFFEPFIILFAIPLGLVGVFLAIGATTGQLGFLELLGVVTMTGIVVNVTILIIDYANQLKREGKSVEEAISTAIALRFRPIVLTQMTAFGSLIPLVFLSPFWQGLAASIIFGIIFSGLLSLISTPILYLWAYSVPEMARNLIRRFRS